MMTPELETARVVVAAVRCNPFEVDLVDGRTLDVDALFELAVDPDRKHVARTIYGAAAAFVAEQLELTEAALVWKEYERANRYKAEFHERHKKWPHPADAKADAIATMAKSATREHLARLKGAEEEIRALGGALYHLERA